MSTSSITIDFSFTERSEDNLRQLNALLAAIKPLDVRLEAGSGYLSAARDERRGCLTRRCGVYRGRLICRLAEEGEGHSFRIDSFTGNHPTKREEEIFTECWQKEHLDRVLRDRAIYRFGEVTAYVFLHRERT